MVINLEGKVHSVGSDALPPNQQQMRQGYAYPAVIKLDSQGKSCRTRGRRSGRQQR